MSDTKPQITHIEIRRVQNGYIIMGLNMMMYDYAHNSANPQRWSYVARDTAEMTTILSALADGADIEWIPTFNLPIMDMVRRVSAKDFEKPADQ